MDHKQYLLRVFQNSLVTNLKNLPMTKIYHSLVNHQILNLEKNRSMYHLKMKNCKSNVRFFENSEKYCLIKVLE